MSNSSAASRSQRAQRKLYLMTLSILVPYLPLTLAFLVMAINGLLPLAPYDFTRIHAGSEALPWSAIVFIKSTDMDFAFLNAPYVPILTAVPIFWFFGMTKEGINMYRRDLLFLGLARLFPRLREEYDPDRRRVAAGSGSGSQPWESKLESRENRG